MRILSYTETGKEKPEGIGAEWPVPFQKGFCEYLHTYEHAEIYLLHEPQSNAMIPLEIKISKIFRFGKILFAPCRNGLPLSETEQKSFFEKLLIFLREQKLCHRLLQPHPMGMTAGYPDDSKHCRFGTYMNDLQAGDDDQLLHTFDPKYRKAVQHSIKNGGRTEFGPHVLEDFYKLYTATTSRAGIYTDPISSFKEQMKFMGEHAEPGVVYDENGPVGSIFNLWSGYHSLCTHAGSGPESRLYGAMKHLHYDMMLRMKRRGVRWYDLVGVRINSNHPGLQGVFRFKKGFGGELLEGYLWKAEIAPVTAKAFDLLVRLRNKGKKSPGDIIDQENENSFAPASTEEQKEQIRN